MNCSERCIINDGFRATGTLQLMQDIGSNLFIIQTSIVVMDGDALAQGFVDRFSEDRIEMGNSLWVLLGSIIVFIVAYATYGAWLARKWGVDDSRKTPAHEQNDGVDYVPTNSAVLLGHHFASIAGAGPINGPIQAAIF